MTKRFGFTLFLIVELITCIIIAHEYPLKTLVIVTICVSLLSILFSILRPIQGLALLVGVVLLAGFFVVEQAWAHHWTTIQQLHGILGHLTLAIFGMCLWIINLYFQRMTTQINRLSSEVKELRKVDEFSGVLTYNEFMYRLEDVITGAKRREECTYILIIKLTTKRKYLIKTLLPKLGTIAVKSIRSKFDIVGILASNQLGICIQKTDKNGCEIVKNRFLNTVPGEMKSNVLEMISIKEIELKGHLEDSIFELKQEIFKGMQSLQSNSHGTRQRWKS